MNKPLSHPLLKEMLASNTRTLIVSILLGLISLFASILLMFLAGYLISATAIPGTVIFSMMIPIGIIQIAGIARPFGNYIERLLSHDWILKITSLLQQKAFRSAAKHIADPENENALGDYHQLINDTITNVQNYIVRALFPLSITYLLCIVISLLTASFSVPLALLLGASFAIQAVIIPLVLNSICRSLILRATLLHQQEQMNLFDHLQGLHDIQLAHREHEMYDIHVKSYQDLIETRQKNNTRIALTQFASSILSSALIVAIIAFVGISTGTTEGYNNYFAACVLAWISLAEIILVVPSLFVEQERYKQTLGHLDLITSQHETTKHNVQSTSSSAPTQAAETPQAIVMQQITYTYPKNRHPSLDIESLSLSKGEHVIVLGESGSGKSTFAKALTGAISPQTGTLKIFCRSRTRPEKKLGCTIGYLDQNPYVFNRTLRANLTLGIYDKSDEELVAILQNVGLGERYSRLKEGLDTIIGETGEQFSDGEAHRIALARTLIQDAQLLVIDEPFCALDIETEEALLELLCDLYQDKTLILITHHLTNVDKFDRALFFRNGSICIDDTIKNLSLTNEHFMKLKAFDR